MFTLLNALGQSIEVMHDDLLSANTVHQFRLDGADLPRGMYFLRVRGEVFDESRPVMLIR